jgi:hypothetical protein
MFMCVMGKLGLAFPFVQSAGTLDNYYLYTIFFLTTPTFLLIREILKIAEIVGINERKRRRRTLL